MSSAEIGRGGSYPSTDPAPHPGPQPPRKIQKPRASQPTLRSQTKRRRRITFTVVGILVLLAAIPIGSAAVVWNNWRGVERETLDIGAFEQLPEVEASTLASTGDAEQIAQVLATASTPTDLVDYETFMIVGTDESELRADVIILVMLPEDGSPPVMISLPRDLYLPNRCTQSFTRINANFNGCGDVNGATALSGAITDFTGYPIDHFALFTFDGFSTIIDRLGGVEICVDHPTQEPGRFELPAGCTTADGATTLGWVRSRKTQELVDGSWRPVTNVSDLTRNERQRDLILTVFQRAAEFSSPQDMAAVVGSMADAFTLDDGLGMAAAVDLVWNNQDLDHGTITRATIPVTDHVTAGGAQVLLPASSFREVLDEALAQ